jgi:hypothetical protein
MKPSATSRVDRSLDSDTLARPDLLTMQPAAHASYTLDVVARTAYGQHCFLSVF